MKFLIVSLLFFNINYAQYQFTYDFQIDDNIKTSVLQVDIENNRSVFKEFIATNRKVTSKFKKEEGLVVSVSATDDEYLKEGNLVIHYTDLLKTRFKVNDPLPEMVWQVTKENRVIESWTCYKAFVNFRGRVWEVWFTPEVPVSYGPWKFYNSPGLIVSAKDNENRFSFTLKEIGQYETFEFPTENKKLKQVDMKTYVENLDDVLNLNSLNISSIYTITSGESQKGLEAIYEWEEERK